MKTAKLLDNVDILNFDKNDEVLINTLNVVFYLLKQNRNLKEVTYFKA